MNFKLSFFNTAASSSSKGRKKTSVFNVVVGFLVVASISYFLYLPQKKAVTTHKLEVGEIAQEDVVIEKDITIEDKESTKLSRQRASTDCLPVYEYYEDNYEKSRKQITRLFSLIDEVKKIPGNGKKKEADLKVKIAEELNLEISEKEIKRALNTEFFEITNLENLLGFLKSLYDKKILRGLAGAKKSKNNTIKLVFKQGDPEILNLADLILLKDARANLKAYV
ncbi:MAG: hypothetical protein GY765_29530, partial [bacterium]|nr:hypothetical protein [bacterium]